jgi:hypothetical protein
VPTNVTVRFQSNVCISVDAHAGSMSQQPPTYPQAITL